MTCCATCRCPETCVSAAERELGAGGGLPAASVGVARFWPSVGLDRVTAQCRQARAAEVVGGQSALSVCFRVGGGERHDVGVGASVVASELLVLVGEREDDGVQHLGAVFEVRVLLAEAGEFLLEFVAWT